MRPPEARLGGVQWLPLLRETELLRLQQILFYRELGFELKKIQQILDQKKFDLEKALKSHRQLLEEKLGRTRQLIETISN